MGSLMYGAGHCWNGMVNMHLRNSSLDDDQFLSFLDHADVPPDITAQRRYPPVALIECVADLTQTHYKVRRLHLVIVDLWRPWKIHKTQVRSLTDQLRRLQPGPHADYTTPSPSWKAICLWLQPRWLRLPMLSCVAMAY